MARLIQNELKKPLAEMILFGELIHGGVVKISLAKSNENTASDEQKLTKLHFNVIQSTAEKSDSTT